MEAFFLLFGALVAGALAVAAASEVLFRAYSALQDRIQGYEISRQDFLDPAYHPYINWTDRWEKAMFRYIPVGLRTFNNDNPLSHVENNSLGFRTREFRYSSPECVRIAVVGGSAAWGFGASCNAATIPGQIERILNDRGGLGGRLVQVFNLAQVNQTQTQDLITGLLFFPRLNPHIVVAMNGWNELAAGITLDATIIQEWGAFPISELVGWEPMAVGANARKMAMDGFLHWASKHFLLVRSLARKARSRRSPLFKRSIRDQVSLASPLFLSHMRQMNVLAKGFGFRYLQVCQPNLFRKLHPVGWELKALELYDQHRQMIGDVENRKYLREYSLYELVEDGVRESPEAFGEFLNLGDIFRDCPARRFHSLVHCTDDGYREIAEAVCEQLIGKHVGEENEIGNTTYLPNRKNV